MSVVKQIPNYQELMLPVLKYAAQGEQRVPDLSEKIADDLGLSVELRDEMLPSGKQRILHNRIHWAKFYMGKAGLIESPTRGRFVATEAGRALLLNNPDKIDVSLLLKNPDFQTFYKGDNQQEAATVLKPQSAIHPEQNTETPEEQIESAYSSINAALRADLLERITSNSPAFFELLIVNLLVAMGYGGSHKNASEQLGRSGDGGVDGIINEDRLGLDRVYVQAKRYASTNTVGRPDIQGFVGSLVGLGANKGVFVTTSSFSQQAKDFVKHLSQRIILIDGRMLTELMIEHQVGVRTQRIIEFKRIDEDFFTED
ncbi:restriction endonuclease [Falsochrobactrum ovis]|uniref:Restriction system protein n=1 Tax=Falsochrobactrum ovis TaxID=1293442 RepID=A0A364JT48_9HYPH|nr:restriction endonuclease [Falsochrobactrum ovis]RAK26793.1 restriction system protein [Falsochrobactrum ovis]